MPIVFSIGFDYILDMEKPTLNQIMKRLKPIMPRIHLAMIKVHYNNKLDWVDCQALWQMYIEMKNIEKIDLDNKG